MSEKLLLIINPVSGDGAAKFWIYDMLHTLSRKYPISSVYFSKSAGDVRKAALENAGQYDAVICAGGDGTLNEMIDGVQASGYSPKLGYIPLGTMNYFALSHGISKNVKVALLDIIRSVPVEYDLGLLGDRAYVCIAAFGAFIEVTYKTPQDAKTSFGILAYLTEAAKVLGDLKPIHVNYEIDGVAGEGEFIYGMVTNTLNVPGVRLVEDDTTAVLKDGKAEITLVKFPNNPKELQEAVAGLLNVKYKTKQVLRFTAKDARFIFGEPVPWTIDGEFGGALTDVNATVVPGRLRILERQSGKEKV